MKGGISLSVSHITLSLNSVAIYIPTQQSHQVSQDVGIAVGKVKWKTLLSAINWKKKKKRKKLNLREKESSSNAKQNEQILSPAHFYTKSNKQIETNTGLVIFFSHFYEAFFFLIEYLCVCLCVCACIEDVN